MQSDPPIKAGCLVKYENAIVTQKKPREPRFFLCSVFFRSDLDIVNDGKEDDPEICNDGDRHPGGQCGG